MVLSFRSSVLEQSWKRHENLKLSKFDGTVCLTLSSLWLGGSIFLATTRSEDAWSELSQGLCGCLLYLGVGLLCRFAHATYVRHRSLVVIGLRLASMMLPTLVGTLKALPAEEELQAAGSGMLSTLALGARLPDVFVLGLGLRLGLPQHLALHSLLAATVILWEAKALCWVPYLANPTTMARIVEITRSLTRGVGLLLPGVHWSAEVLDTHWQQPQLCYALVVTVHLVCGFVLSSMAVYIVERWSRARYTASLAQQAAAARIAMPQAAQELGFRSQGELVSEVLFDPLAACVRCTALLLPLGALTWLGVLMIAGWRGTGLPAPGQQACAA